MEPFPSTQHDYSIQFDPSENPPPETEAKIFYEEVETIALECRTVEQTMEIPPLTFASTV